MEELETTLQDLKSVLEAIPEVKLVSHGKPCPLLTDNNLPAIYIVPTNEAFEPVRRGTCIGAYDGYVYIKLIVNMSCSTDLEWVSFRSTVINAVLNDTDLWRSIIDRDLVATSHDDYDNYPKKSFQVAFEFRLRANIC